MPSAVVTGSQVRMNLAFSLFLGGMASAASLGAPGVDAISDISISGGLLSPIPFRSGGRIFQNWDYHHPSSDFCIRFQ